MRITFAGSPLPKCPSFCCYVSGRDYRGRIEFHWACARLNNSVIRGTRNDDMEVLMRTYILAIATAALFAIPTAAFSEGMYFGFGPGGVRIGPSYGHHRLYNRYEGGWRLRRIAAGLPSQARTRRGGYGQLPGKPPNVPLVQGSELRNPGRNSSGFFPFQLPFCSSREALSVWCMAHQRD